MILIFIFEICGLLKVSLFVVELEWKFSFRVDVYYYYWGFGILLKFNYDLIYLLKLVFL